VSETVAERIDEKTGKVTGIAIFVFKDCTKEFYTLIVS